MTQLRLIQHRLVDAFSQFPERVAIAAGGRTVTYKELDLLAAAVAQKLYEEGVSPGTVCAILVDDRVDMIALLLGIMRYGCVFMPLDSTYPDRRVEAMVRQVGQCSLFVDKANQERLGGMTFGAGHGVRVLEAGAGLFSAESSGTGIQPFDSQKNDPLYIYFTSGTTGAPKGIVGKNSSPAHFIDWEIRSFTVGDGWRVAHLTSPAFDASLRDFFVPLCTGGTICIPEERTAALNERRLRQWLEECEIQLLHCTPSLFKVLNNESLHKDSYPKLRTILLAGEELHPQDLGHWLDTIGSRVQLVNMYGPSETTLLKTAHFIRESDASKERLPIGTPISNTRIIILNQDRQICPAGVKGEIYIRTPYRTLGYLNNPKATAESYIPNPFGNKAEDIVYKTGDFGRLLENGAIEFLGRGDRQVKIRGNRVEMKEIETQLLRHPAVEQCLVQARKLEESGELFLTAYIVMPAEVDAVELRDFLKQSCPDYFIPAFMIPIQRIPLTPNNKVDTRALPDPLKMETASFTPAQTKTEADLAGIWSDLFHLDRVGVDQDFFSLGGHSLTAVTLCARILKAFQVDVPLKEIFDRPTIRLQAELIDRLDKSGFSAVRPVEEREYYPLSKAQERMFVAAQLRADVTDYNMTAIRLLEGTLNVQRLQEAFETLIHRHDTLRTTFTVIDGEPVQRVWRRVELPLEEIDLRDTVAQLGEDDAIDTVLEDFIRPFQLDETPLLRVRLARLGVNRYALFYDMHHIISDAVSLAILGQEFLDAYHHRPLPPLTLQYRDFSLWQAGTADSNYWLDLYAGDIPEQRIPVDFPAAKRFGMKEETLTFQLDRQLTARIRQFTKEVDITTFMLLVAVYALLLSRYSGQNDIVVGVPVAARGHADLERIIGMFVNILPLRFDVSGQTTFNDFVRQVKDRSIAAFAHQDYPFDELVRQLGLSRQTDTNPLFDVVFQTHEMPVEETGERDDDEFRVLPYENRRSTSKFSLILESYDMGETFTMTQQFSTALYKRSSIQEMTGLYTELLQQALDHPAIPLRDIRTGDQTPVSQVLPDDLDNFDF
jgi:amino acid adenylation domain-containing protein